MSFYLEDDQAWQDSIEQKIKSISARNRDTPVYTVNQNFGTSGMGTRGGAAQSGTSAVSSLATDVTNGAMTLLNTNAIVDDASSASQVVVKQVNGLVKDGTSFFLTTVPNKTMQLVSYLQGGIFNIEQSIIVPAQTAVMGIYNKATGLVNLLAGAANAGPPSGTDWSEVTIDTANLPGGIKDMQKSGIDDLLSLLFTSSGSNIGFETSGDGTVLNVEVDGAIIANFSRLNAAQGTFQPKQSVLEIIDSFASGYPTALKLDYLPATPVAGQQIGEIDFDSYTTLNIQESFAKIIGKTISISNNAFIGELQFWIAANGTTEQVMNIEGGQTNAPVGLNMLGHPIYLLQSISFDAVGATIYENTNGLFLEIISPQTAFYFYQNATEFLAISENEIQPITTISLGDSAHFFSAAYSQIYAIGSANQTLGWDGNGDLVWNQQTGKTHQWQFDNILRVDIQDTGSGVSFSVLNNGTISVEGISDPHPFTISKFTSNAAQIACADNFQFANDILCTNSTQHIGNNATPWYWEYLLNLEFIDNLAPSNNTIINYQNDYLRFNLQNAAGLSSVGFTFQYQGTSWFSLVPDPVAGLPYFILDIGQTINYTSASAGSASALPLLPARYLYLEVDGTPYKVALYNP